jgi:PAS domain S-box-containing protein
MSGADPQPVHFFSKHVCEFAARIYSRLERADADERLRQSEVHLRALVNQNVGGIEADLEGYLTFVNDRFSEIVGYTRDELLSATTLQSLIHLEEWNSTSERLHRLLATGEPFQVENRYVRKDGGTAYRGL